MEDVEGNNRIAEGATALMTAIIVAMEQARTSRAAASAASDMAAIGRRIRAARLAKGFRPVDLAAIAGVTNTQIWNWENAASRPRVDQVARIVPVLEVTLDFLYLGNDNGLSWPVREAIMAIMQAPDADDEAGTPKRKTTAAD